MSLTPREQAMLDEWRASLPETTEGRDPLLINGVRFYAMRLEAYEKNQPRKER